MRPTPITDYLLKKLKEQMPNIYPATMVDEAMAHVDAVSVALKALEREGHLKALKLIGGAGRSEIEPPPKTRKQNAKEPPTKGKGGETKKVPPTQQTTKTPTVSRGDDPESQGGDVHPKRKVKKSPPIVGDTAQWNVDILIILDHPKDDLLSEGTDKEQVLMISPNVIVRGLAVKYLKQAKIALVMATGQCNHAITMARKLEPYFGMLKAVVIPPHCDEETQEAYAGVDFNVVKSSGSIQETINKKIKNFLSMIKRAE